MKKLIAILLAMMLVLSLAACGAEEEPNADLVITRAAEEDVAAEVQPEAEAEEPVVADGVFSFTASGVELIPGEAFDAAALGEAASVYTVPSCAIEGTDNVYNYETFEVTAYDDGTGEVVYSIYFLDPNLTTTEGLALGDDAAKVVELYGEDFAEEGASYVYTRTNTQLHVIFQNDAVTSIEYRLVTG